MEFVVDHALVLGGMAALIVAAMAWWGDRRRLRRADLDRVGLAPWTGLFFWSLLVGAVMLAGALEVWLAGR